VPPGSGLCALSKRPQDGAWVAESHGRLLANTDGRDRPFAGQAVDSILVMTIAFAGVMSTNDIFRAVVSGYTAKVLYEAATTPVTYAVVGFLKRKEGVDVMDIGANFSPFAI
jgi:queuosine precursor transporter